ncbi:MAG: DUF6252 family protein [Cytophagales bacterium]|nr:DUF6252 family protein [Cytophagales bacterium]
MHLPILLSAGMLFWLGSCKKENTEPLPEATQVGANTLGCKVNGRNWVAQDSNEPFNRTFGVEGGYQGALVDSIRNCVWIEARRNDGTLLHLYMRRVDKPGIYPLRLLTDGRPGALVPYDYGFYFDSSVSYMTKPSHTGTVTVTRADPTNGIVSGTFEFTASDPKNQRTVTITDGRFDVKTR